MNKYKKGFTQIIFIAVGVLILVVAGGAAYVYKEKKPKFATYSIEECGISVQTKKDLPLSEKTQYPTDHSLMIGEREISWPDLIVSCSSANRWEPDNIDVQKYIGISGGDAKEVEKNNYLVFDKKALSKIDKLYSVTPAPLQLDGSEKIGFKYGDWYYAFTFKNTNQVKNQDDFIISVSPAKAKEVVPGSTSQNSERTNKIIKNL